MANELIRLIDPESAHAIEETAKAAGKAVDVAAGAGKYVVDVLGELPHDLLGIAGDWVKQKRARRWAELSAETEKILYGRGARERIDPSPSVVIPLIAAAIDEDRDGLKELWAKLLAATLDPARSGFFRATFIDVTKKMDPLDAVVLEAANGRGGAINGTTRNDLAAALKASRDQIDVAVANLVKLELAGIVHQPDAALTPLGREFLRAVAN
jgi:hypothetical protein